MRSATAVHNGSTDKSTVGRMTVRTQPAWRLLLKMFLFFGGGFAVSLAAISIIGGGAMPTRVAVEAGIFFGVLMTPVLGGLHIIRSYSRGYSQPVALVQVAAVTVAGPASLAVEAVRRSLPSIPARETASWGIGHPVLKARAGKWWTWWGEEMRFEFHPNANGSIEVHVISRPRSRLVLADMGRSLTNVERFLDAIRPSEI